MSTSAAAAAMIAPLEEEQFRLPVGGAADDRGGGDDRQRRRQQREGCPLDDRVAVADRRLGERGDTGGDEEGADEPRGQSRVVGDPERAREDQRHGDVRPYHRQVVLRAEQQRREQRGFVVDAVLH
jgi:hypothetical protein